MAASYANRNIKKLNCINRKLHMVLIIFLAIFLNSPSKILSQNSFQKNNPSIINQYLKDLTIQNSEIATALSIGHSSLGHELLLIDIQSNKNTATKTVYLGALHHGNEFISLEASLHFLESIFINKERDFVKRILKDVRILVQPMANPDGFEFGKREDSKGIDINRDFEYPSSSTNDTFKSDISRHLRSIFERVKVDAAISLHSGTKAILYPWCYSEKPTEDQKMFSNLAQLLATNLEHQIVKQSFFDYPTKGELIDYLYMKYKSLAFTMEINEEHWVENILDRQRLLERTTKAQFMFLDAISKNHTSNKTGTLELSNNQIPTRNLPQYINIGMNSVLAPQP